MLHLLRRHQSRHRGLQVPPARRAQGLRQELLRQEAEQPLFLPHALPQRREVEQQRQQRQQRQLQKQQQKRQQQQQKQRQQQQQQQQHDSETYLHKHKSTSKTTPIIGKKKKKLVDNRKNVLSHKKKGRDMETVIEGGLTEKNTLDMSKSQVLLE